MVAYSSSSLSLFRCVKCTIPKGNSLSFTPVTTPYLLLRVRFGPGCDDCLHCWALWGYCQENDDPAVDHRHVHKITLTLALQSDQAGPSRATIRESNPLMIEILKLSYVTNPPRFDQPAGPSVATIPENKKPAVENQLKPIYKISPPPVSLPVEDSQLGQPAGSSAATVYEKSKFFDGGSRQDENSKA